MTELRRELRKDPIAKRWVIIASGRAQRPEHFKREDKQDGSVEILCPFCPKNEGMTPSEIRTFPERKPKDSPGWQVRVVPNKHNAVGVDEEWEVETFGLYEKMTAYGAHEVIIESPEHSVLFEEQPLKHLELVLNAYKERLIDLYKDPYIKQIVLYKNHGPGAGASISHPHSQLITFPIVPDYIKKELNSAKEYFQEKRSCIWCSILKWETRANFSLANEDDESQFAINDPAGLRIVYKNPSFVAIAPFASRFPYEIHFIPRRHSHCFSELGEKGNFQEVTDLAEILKTVIKKLNVVLKNAYPESVPFNLVFHTAPNLNFKENGNKFATIKKDFHWHIELYPLWSIPGSVEKGSGFYINIVPPEIAAQELREAQIE